MWSQFINQYDDFSRDTIQERMVKCHRCIAEEEAGMACLSCPCSSVLSSTTTITRAELNMEDLIVLDIEQLRNLCVNGNLPATGNRATLIDRLLCRSRSICYEWGYF